jgi:hypothetical protein
MGNIDGGVFGALVVLVIGIIAFLYAWFFEPPGKHSGQDR